MPTENHSAPAQPNRFHVGRIFLLLLAKTLGAIVLLILGLRFLNVFGLNAFRVRGYDPEALRNQILALLFFVGTQLGGGALLRSLFRKRIPEIDQNQGAIDRLYSILRWTVLFFVISGVTVLAFFVYARKAHIFNT